MLRLSLQSLWNRRFAAALTTLAIALSVALILGVERLRTEARAGFSNAASGIDLVVAARGNDVQILLATVLGTGGTGSGIRWDSYQMVADLPQVAWSVPIMMGDNHRGFPVVGTTADYFDRFRHSGGQALEFRQGGGFSSPTGAVIGSEVADAFGYATGTQIVNAHGAGSASIELHDETPFTVVGLLAPTGTAVDRMVFVTLEGFDAIHARGAPRALDPLTPPVQASAPETINAAYVGLTDRAAVLTVQRAIFDYPGEALSAVMPNVALLQLWEITGTAETALRLMASAVAVAGLIGMVVMLSAALDGRRREFAILRSVGATPANIFVMIIIEAVLLLSAGVVLGYLLMTVGIMFAEPILAERFGLRLGAEIPSVRELALVGAVFAAGLGASVLPAARVYRMTVADGMAVRL